MTTFYGYDLSKCTISHIHQGKGKRSCYVYADLYSPDGELLISATLDYINKKIIKQGQQHEVNQ